MVRPSITTLRHGTAEPDSEEGGTAGGTADSCNLSEEEWAAFDMLVDKVGELVDSERDDPNPSNYELLYEEAFQDSCHGALLESPGDGRSRSGVPAPPPSLTPLAALPAGNDPTPEPAPASAAGRCPQGSAGEGLAADSSELETPCSGGGAGELGDAEHGGGYIPRYRERFFADDSPACWTGDGSPPPTIPGFSGSGIVSTVSLSAASLDGGGRGTGARCAASSVCLTITSHIFGYLSIYFK